MLPAALEKYSLSRKNKVDELLLENNSSWSSFVVKSEREGFEAQLLKTIFFSDFVLELFEQRTQDCMELFLSVELFEQRDDDFYSKSLIGLSENCETQEQWMAALRKFRQMEMLRFIWREVNALADIRQNATEISHFAKAAIDVSLDFLYQKQVEVMGTPYSVEDGSEQKLCVLGMGKLGGNELNLSSDIDLIFFYKDTGHTDAPRQVENQKFFVKLAQQLIRTLDERTIDGFVFRVDMRLRPYGDSGLLVLNQNAMELYYETQGRTWERYAFIKADWVAGDKELAEGFLEAIRPFVYRKYVDFTVVESLREMKQLINRQVVSKGLQDDIKLGEGGIRELEFIVQALQLIKGGRKPDLQHKSYYQAMASLLPQGLMAEEDIKTLCNHYSFFRRVEHLIQARADEQSQLLPKEDEKGEILAWVMGFKNYSEFRVEVQSRREQVRAFFNDLFAEPKEEIESSDSELIQLEKMVSAWQQVEEQDIDFELDNALAKELNESIRKFAAEKSLKSLSENEKKRLDQCMAYLIFKIASFESPNYLLDRVIKFIRIILHRSAYLVLLIENPKVFDYLLSLFQRSEWALDNLIQHPFLLDELLQIQNKALDLKEINLADEMRQLSLRMHASDLETVLEELRLFKCAHEMQAAAMYLDRQLSTSDLGDFLSELAMVIVQEVSRLALIEAVKGENKEALQQYIRDNFAIVAYGKLGSREMGFGSDLDLVFVFKESKAPVDDLGRALTRYGQKIIHLLSVRTYSGILYEVDMRLRPSGKSGPMVSSLMGFEKYQRENAWTWEHQALVKARVVHGSTEMNDAFEEIRASILSEQRKPSEILANMLEMQKRLRENSPVANEQSKFHLKSEKGGLVDIEFLAQYLVLTQASSQSELVKAHATLEIFDFFEQDQAIKPEWLPALRKIYLRFRRQINELTLAYQKVILPQDSFVEERAEINEVWASLEQAHL
jgi:glutamate-ammonia-ligase adenylyltransferase